MSIECSDISAPEPTTLESFDDPRLALFASLTRAADAYLSDANAICQEQGITFQQYNVLRILYVHDPGRGLACSRIAERLVARVPDMTRLLDRLAKADFIERGRCAGDRRVVRTRLSPTGRELVEALDGPLLGLLDRLTERLGDVDLTTLTQTLARFDP